MDENSLGWLSPAGVFYESDFGEHEEMAFQIVERNVWEDLWADWKAQGNNSRLCGDFLVYVKGYVLLHNPDADYSEGPVATYERRLTKAQREFLYNYYMKENMPEKAASFIR